MKKHHRKSKPTKFWQRALFVSCTCFTTLYPWYMKNALASSHSEARNSFMYIINRENITDINSACNAHFRCVRKAQFVLKNSRKCTRHWVKDGISFKLLTDTKSTSLLKVLFTFLLFIYQEYKTRNISSFLWLGCVEGKSFPPNWNLARFSNKAHTPTLRPYLVINSIISVFGTKSTPY